MADISKRLLDMLSGFTINEIGTKVINGVTYTMLIKNDSKRDQDLYKQYMAIRDEATACGFNDNEVFRRYEVSNGYIFDMDISTAKQIVMEIAKTAPLSDREILRNMIQTKPDARRKADIEKLGKFLKTEYESGRTQVEVALFNRNTTGRISVTLTGANNSTLMIRYNAYSIRPLDIELVNEKYLIPNGFRVKSLKSCEILPSKSGVSFLITMESMDEFRQKRGF